MKKQLFFIISAIFFTTSFLGCSRTNTTNKVNDNKETPTIESTALDSTTEALSEIESTEKSDSKTEPETTTETDSVTKEPETSTETETVTEPATELVTEPVTTPPTEATTEPITTPPTLPPTEPQTQAPTPPPTEPPTEAPSIKGIVDIIAKETSVTSDYKFGIKKITTTSDYYYVFSDGSEEYGYSSTDDSYDFSGYAATDAELLEESISTAAANMEFYNEVLTLVNQIRAEVGVHPLTLDTTLCQAATMRSLEMNYSTQFSHTRPNGTVCFSVFDTFPTSYSSAGENIAAGYSSAAAVVEGWKNSPGHYQNMINEDYNKLGVGMSDYSFGYGIYWTQLFTN